MTLRVYTLLAICTNETFRYGQVFSLRKWNKFNKNHRFDIIFSNILHEKPIFVTHFSCHFQLSIKFHWKCMTSGSPCKERNKDTIEKCTTISSVQIVHHVFLVEKFLENLSKNCKNCPCIAWNRLYSMCQCVEYEIQKKRKIPLHNHEFCSVADT